MVYSVLIMGVVDIGSCVTLLDMKMAEALGVPVKQAKSREFRWYIIPVVMQSCAYLGIVDRLLTIELLEHISSILTSIRVMKY